MKTPCPPSPYDQATVRGGDLYVLSLDAFPENWRQTGNSLKRIRGSFDVSPVPPAPEAGGALQVS